MCLYVYEKWREGGSEGWHEKMDGELLPNLRGTSFLMIFQYFRLYLKQGQKSRFMDDGLELYGIIYSFSNDFLNKRHRNI